MGPKAKSLADQIQAKHVPAQLGVCARDPAIFLFFWSDCSLDLQDYFVQQEVFAKSIGPRGGYNEEVKTGEWN